MSMLLYPVPRRAEFGNRLFTDSPPGIAFDFNDNELSEAADGVFFRGFPRSGDIIIHAEYSADASLCVIPETGKPSDEIYRLSLHKKADGIRTNIEYHHKKGLWHALFTLEKILSEKRIPEADILDYPLFETRGYIEGFYGKPWTFEGRMRVMRLMAEYGMNTHYYAPKDDPYHRKRWREPYPEKELAELKKLSDAANSFGIDLAYCIAPGLSMTYSSAADFKALCEKTKQLYAIGIHSFGLLLDDIPPFLSHTEDAAAFPDLASAHVYICNKYRAFLGSLGACALTVCPTEYSGKADGGYITSFGKALLPDIRIFYTGADICSKEMTSRESVIFEQNTAHKPLYWDNYPVNDAEMFKEMHLGPVTGRDSDLYLYSDGLIANCMEYCECSCVPLITIACYLWNPPAYIPEVAYNLALIRLIPNNADREAVAVLADNLRTSCLKDENSRIMGTALSIASAYREKGDLQAFTETVSELALTLREAADRLGGREDGIFGELKEWTDKFLLCSNITDIAADIVLNRADRKRELKEKIAAYNNCATVLTSFCFREFVEAVLEL